MEGGFVVSKFGVALADLTNAGLREGIPPEEIVLSLEMISHELKNGMLAHAAEHLNKGNESSIIHPHISQSP
jgi:hypothetical protein